MGWKISLDLVSALLEGKTVLVEGAADYPRVVRRAAELCLAGKPTVVLTTGDACVSAALEEILSAFRGAEVEVIPGISSVQMAAGRAGVSLEESVVVSFHKLGSVPARVKWVVDSLGLRRNVICLLDEEYPASLVAQWLLERKVSAVREVFVCENLSLPNERVFRGSLRQVAKERFQPLSVAVFCARRGGVERVA